MNINEIIDCGKTDRSRFNESFLRESPQRHDPAEYFDPLNYIINDYMSKGANKTFVSTINGFDLFKLDFKITVYYWFELNNNPLLIIELEKKNRSLVVNLLGKKGKGLPYAVDLYTGILNDTNKSVTITSDNQITEKGLNVWKRLFDQGHKITVYDTSNVGPTWRMLSFSNDLELYFGDDVKYKNYRYVLSESTFANDTKSFFMLRQIREESGSALED